LSGLTVHNRISGTPAYMAPEQILGKSPSEACDVYAVGQMFWEMLAGQPAFPGPPEAIMMRKLNDTDTPDIHSIMPGASDTAVAAIRQCMQRDPTARPGARDLLATLNSDIDITFFTIT